MRPTLAIDCDLRKIYATDATGAVIAKADQDMRDVISFMETHNNPLILMEVSSPLFYRESPRAVYHTARWALWNIVQAEKLDHASVAFGAELLVSPSSSWTMGHGLLARHKIANCRQPEKNLRETEAMLFFHLHNPDQWLPLGDYLDAI